VTAAQEERLLELAAGLGAELAKVPVHLLDDPSGPPAGLGVPASCVGHLTSFLERERDLERLRAFLDRLGQLDEILGQNQVNPRAQHSALGRVVSHWLKQQPELSADEWLYVLAWVRRLLPKSAKTEGPPPQAGRRPPKGHQDQRDPETQRDPEPVRGRQLAAALQRALDPKKPR
jgi:hypothetical protein